MTAETIFSIAFLILQIVFLLGTWQIAKYLVKVVLYLMEIATTAKAMWAILKEIKAALDKSP